MLWPRLVLPTPGGPTKHRIGSRAGLSPVTGGGSAGTGASPTMARPACALLPELLDGQVFEDPLLDLLQVEVVLVQYLPRPVMSMVAPPSLLQGTFAIHSR